MDRGPKGGCDESQGHQLLRRTGGAAAAGPRARPGRAARLHGDGHVGDGDLSPRQGVRRGAQRGDRTRQGAACGPRQLQDPPAAGRRQPAVRDAADEPAPLRTQGRLHRHRLVGEEGVQGGQGRRRRRGPRHRDDRDGEVQAPPPPGRDQGQPRRRVRAPLLEQHDLRHAVEGVSHDRFDPARGRHVVRLHVASVRRQAVRVHLRRGPEEPRAVRARGRDHPRRRPRPLLRQASERCCSTRSTPTRTRCSTPRPASRSTSCATCSPTTSRSAASPRSSRTTARRAASCTAASTRSRSSTAAT